MHGNHILLQVHVVSYDMGKLKVQEH